MSKEIILLGELLLRLSPTNHLNGTKSNTSEAQYRGADVFAIIKK